MDMVIPIEQMPLKGETILGGNITHVPGGKGANQASAAGKLGGNVAMLGCVGTDQFGKDQTENLLKAGVDVFHIGERGQLSIGIALFWLIKKEATALWLHLEQTVNVMCSI